MIRNLGLRGCVMGLLIGSALAVARPAAAAENQKCDTNAHYYADQQCTPQTDTHGQPIGGYFKVTSSGYPYYSCVDGDGTCDNVATVWAGTLDTYSGTAGCEETTDPATGASNHASIPVDRDSCKATVV